MKEKTINELAGLLALQMQNVAEMEVDGGVNNVSEEKFKWMALGFSVALEIEGFPVEMAQQIIEEALVKIKSLQA